jgi:glucose PTS system EIICB or EIICBA component
VLGRVVPEELSDLISGKRLHVGLRHAARKASGYIYALGGAGNIVRVDACAETRLRVVLRDLGKVGESALRAEGIAAVVRLEGGVLHLLAGLNADQYAAEMRGQLAAAASSAAAAVLPAA